MQARPRIQGVAAHPAGLAACQGRRWLGCGRVPRYIKVYCYIMKYYYMILCYTLLCQMVILSRASSEKGWGRPGPWKWDPYIHILHHCAHIYIYTYSYTYIYIYVYVSLSLSLSLYIYIYRERGREFYSWASTKEDARAQDEWTVARLSKGVKNTYGESRDDPSTK